MHTFARASLHTALALTRTYMKVEQSDHAFLPVVHTLYYPLHTHTHTRREREKCPKAAGYTNVQQQRIVVQVEKERKSKNQSLFLLFFLHSLKFNTHLVRDRQLRTSCRLLRYSLSYSQLLSVILPNLFFTSVCCACVLFRECRANSRKNILIFDTKTSSFFLNYKICSFVSEI